MGCQSEVLSGLLRISIIHEFQTDFIYGMHGNALIKSKLQHPPPPSGKPRAFDYFLCPGVGNLTGKASPGVGNLTLRGWGGEN